MEGRRGSDVVSRLALGERGMWAGHPEGFGDPVMNSVLEYVNLQSFAGYKKTWRVLICPVPTRVNEGGFVSGEKAARVWSDAVTEIRPR